MIRGSLPAMTNRESFVDEIELIDADDGSLWDLTGVTAKIQLELVGDFYAQTGYLPYFGYGWCPTARLLATTENGGAIIIGSQAIQFTFTEAQMASLPSGQYRLSATATRDNITIQVCQLDMPILYGGVPQ